jgi:hypothetical protein
VGDALVVMMLSAMYALAVCCQRYTYSKITRRWRDAGDVHGNRIRDDSTWGCDGCIEELSRVLARDNHLLTCCAFFNKTIEKK